MKLEILEKKKAQKTEAQPAQKMEERLASLQAMTRLSGVPLQVKEICQDWLLLTFDLPCTDAGNKMRRKFLNMVKAIGASQHTESVYLLPWTPVSESAAIDIASVGNAFLWTSNVKDILKAKELTAAYDADIAKRIGTLYGRVEKIERCISTGRKNSAMRMMSKTSKMMKELREIVVQRGSQRLIDEFEITANRLLNALSAGRQKGEEDGEK